MPREAAASQGGGRGPGVGDARLASLAVVAALIVGGGLVADAARRSSATYDEVAYLRVAARWWRTGDQEAITRMGSPLTFWKLQQVPTLWVLDRTGHGDWIDDPIGHQAELLPVVRLGSVWLWGLGLVVTSLWARRLYGPRAMALAAWLFALEPNLLAHGGLATMEAPLVAFGGGVLYLFWEFLRGGGRRYFWGAACLCGLAFSCKFTAVVLPPILGLAYWIDRAFRRGGNPIGSAGRVGVAMAGFVAAMAATDLVVTGFACIPPSESRGEHPSIARRVPEPFRAVVARAFEVPCPQDWVAFAIQARHQASGGPSYLMGERRMRGWWWYYPVALAVKLPLALLALMVVRGVFARRIDPGRRAWMPAMVAVTFLILACLGSSRNYGVRYLLPMAPAAIVWLSGLAEGPRWGRIVGLAGLAGMAAAVGWAHPHELSYFNRVAGGTEGGRRILADSNLDWGQGARALARLQTREPAYRDLTLYYFGDTDPGHYGVVGVRRVIDAGEVHPGLPTRFEASTGFVAVSASLQWGPWGPEGYFRPLRGLSPVAMTEDGTIAVYRTDQIPGLATSARASSEGGRASANVGR